MRHAHLPASLTIRALLAAATATMLPALAAPALAQEMMTFSFSGSPGGSGGPGPSISRKTLGRYAGLLGLSPDQREAAEALHDAYLESNRQASEEMREAMEAVRAKAGDGGDVHVFTEELPKVMGAHAQKQTAIEDQFLADLRTMLNADQESRWPRLERLRRREGSLEMGVVSGERVDLVRIVDELKLAEEPRATLADTLESYESELDRVLVERLKVQEEQRQGQTPGMMVFDSETMDKHMKDMREAGVRVRDVNRRFAKAIETLLPEASVAAFMDSVEKESFPHVYREPHVSRQVAAAEKFDDLTDEQRAQLRAIREAYTRESEAINRRWARAIAKAEESGKGNNGMFSGPGGEMIMIPGFGDEDPDVAEARQARASLDEKTGEKLASALNEKQRDRLPKQTRRTVNQTVGADEEGMVGEAQILIIEEDDAPTGPN